MSNPAENKPVLSNARQAYVNRLFDDAKHTHANAITFSSLVAKHNSLVLRQLEERFQTNPDFDLASEALFQNYSTEIQSIKHEQAEQQRKLMKYMWLAVLIC